MKLYLVRHAQAEGFSTSDATRVLTQEGHRDAHLLGEKLLTLENFTVSRVIHSGYVRAKKTAEIIHQVSNLEVPIEEDSSLAPDADIAPWLNFLNGGNRENLMLVGHMPFMGELSFALLGSRTGFGRPSCLIVEKNASWETLQFLTP